jgi:hypothetical protein
MHATYTAYHRSIERKEEKAKVKERRKNGGKRPQNVCSLKNFRRKKELDRKKRYYH